MYIPKIITFQFRLFYESLPGEEVYIYGENEDFGNWTKPNFKLYWHDGNIWTADYKISENIEYVKFKFVVKSDYCEKWEEGGNRLLSTRILKGLEKTNDGKYIIDCMWQHFKINFNIHYILNRNSYMRIIGGNDCLHNWMSSVRLELENHKKIVAKDGNEIEGFWTKTFYMKSNVGNNYTFDYRYSAFDEKQNSAIWEREPNRHIHILTELNDENYHLFANNPDEYKLLTNSYLEVLDVNFVADLIFNKMGDKPIFIGPYPQNLADYKMLKNAGINATLNVQSNGDLKHRQINLELHKKQAWEIGIEIHHYPIEDFNSNDLANRLKGAGDKLNELLRRGKTVYVHCTAGMSRAAATVIIYLVLYENWKVYDAKEFVKRHRPVICPNYGVINMIAKKYKPGKEMENYREEKVDMESVWKRVRRVDMEFKKDINKENERIRLKEIEDENQRFLEEEKEREKEREKEMEKEKNNNLENVNEMSNNQNQNEVQNYNNFIQDQNDAFNSISWEIQDFETPGRDVENQNLENKNNEEKNNQNNDERENIRTKNTKKKKKKGNRAKSVLKKVSTALERKRKREEEEEKEEEEEEEKKEEEEEEKKPKRRNLKIKKTKNRKQIKSVGKKIKKNENASLSQGENSTVNLTQVKNEIKNNENENITNVKIKVPQKTKSKKMKLEEEKNQDETPIPKKENQEEEKKEEEKNEKEKNEKEKSEEEKSEEEKSEEESTEKIELQNTSLPKLKVVKNVNNQNIAVKKKISDTAQVLKKLKIQKVLDSDDNSDVSEEININKNNLFNAYNKPLKIPVKQNEQKDDLKINKTNVMDLIKSKNETSPTKKKKKVRPSKSQIKTTKKKKILKKEETTKENENIENKTKNKKFTKSTKNLVDKFAALNNSVDFVNEGKKILKKNTMNRTNKNGLVNNDSPTTNKKKTAKKINIKNNDEDSDSESESSENEIIRNVKKINIRQRNKKNFTKLVKMKSAKSELNLNEHKSVGKKLIKKGNKNLNKSESNDESFTTSINLKKNSGKNSTSMVYKKANNISSKNEIKKTVSNKVFNNKKNNKIEESSEESSEESESEKNIKTQPKKRNVSNKKNVTIKNKKESESESDSDSESESSHGYKIVNKYGNNNINIKSQKNLNQPVIPKKLTKYDKSKSVKDVKLLNNNTLNKKDEKNSDNENNDFSYKYNVKKQPVKKKNKKKVKKPSNKKKVIKKEESESSSEESEESDESNDSEESEESSDENENKNENKTGNNFNKKPIYNHKIIEDIYRPKRKIGNNGKSILFNNTSKYYQKKNNSNIAKDNKINVRGKRNLSQQQKNINKKKIDVSIEDESGSESNEE